MLQFLSDYFSRKGIRLFAPIPLGNCRVTRGYLLERAGLDERNGTAIMLAIPYFTSAALSSERNISAYAVPRDYHLFFRELFDDLLPRLRERFPTERFAGFADHSPIDERDAAARAGLGLFGLNGMLITEPYSSYVFLGELVTSAALPCNIREPQTCEGCGACRRACPMGELGTCLSALTQKKGDLTADETAAIRRFGSAWGCDICSEVCPHTAKAKKNGTLCSEIPFFSAETITRLTVEALDGMTDQAFADRAFAWRGRSTVRRNLCILEQDEQTEQTNKEDRPC